MDRGVALATLFVVKESALPITVGFSLLLKTVCVFVLSVLPVSVKTNDGKVLEGDLDGFTRSSLLLSQNGEIVEYPFDDLLSLRPVDAGEETPPTFGRVILVGGSSVFTQDLALIDNHLLIELRRQNRLRVPIKQVKAIRFRAASVATDAQWLGILDGQSRGDTLVIRRPGNRLDPQQGVVESIENAAVAFDLDGTKINAPIDRLEGVIFAGTQAIVENADIRVTDVYGSNWSIVSIEPSRGDQPLQMRLSNSVLHELPLHDIDSIRWSGGFSLLADEKPARTSFQPYFQTKVGADLLADFFAPNPDGDGDLRVYGGSSIEYRIEPGFHMFAGTVRRDRNVTQAGEVTVRIELDDKKVWEEQLRDAEPRGFELDVQQSRRLTIRVDSRDDGELGDTVRFSRPRLLK